MNLRKYQTGKYGKLFLVALFLSILALGNVTGQEKKQTKKITILGLGDSITEGGGHFTSYLFPLWEKLFAGGYTFEFIGPRESKCRIGKINCAGYSGRNAEYLNSIIDSIYRKYPADIVLVHSGHNHFYEEKPIDGIIASQKSMIGKIKAINPNVKIIVAQVIVSGKLPKYSYISELNKQIAKMVKKLHDPKVILVNQAKGFNWQEMTISDHVHPNLKGAEKMADVWFATLKRILPHPLQVFQPEILTYKTIDSTTLKLHVFKPDGLKNGKPRPAIIYFFGGGWTLGTPLQFYRECAYYASKGMVAISADYRISSVNKTTPFESVDDARDAIRWLREHAEELNINPEMIAATGSSAGGHLAAATGILPESDLEKQKFSSKPNLLALYYAVIDNSKNGYGFESVKKRSQEISPLHNITSSAPPTLFILGMQDQLIPVETAKLFQKKMLEAGVQCELHLIEGAGHPIFYYAKDLTDNFYKIREMTDHFLVEHGYLRE